MNSHTFSKSFVLKPRDVRAGEPKRKPRGSSFLPSSEQLRLDFSPGHVNLLHEILISPKTLSTRLPSVPFKKRQVNTVQKVKKKILLCFSD